MNCAQAEKQIYVYRELTARERMNLEHHLAECPACQAMMDRVAEEQVIMKTIRDLRPAAPDHSRITRRIMSEVEAHESNQNLFYLFRLEASVRPIRYAMATVSLILLATFAAEYYSGDGSASITKRFPLNARDQVPLNSASFLKSLTTRQTTSRTQTIYACIAGCGEINKVDCAKCEKFSKF